MQKETSNLNFLQLREVSLAYNGKSTKGKLRVQRRSLNELTQLLKIGGSMERLLTYKDASLLLGISESTLRHAVSERGKHAPPFVKLGRGTKGSVRFRESDLEAWVESKIIKEASE